MTRKYTNNWMEKKPNDFEKIYDNQKKNITEKPNG